jgi:hypothetical protein
MCFGECPPRSEKDAWVSEGNHFVVAGIEADVTVRRSLAEDLEPTLTESL